MKKILSLLLCFAFIVSLCGCGNKSARETDMEYMVSSIGFDNEGKKTKIIAEIIVVNSGQNDSGAQTEVLVAVGDSPKDALYSLHSKLSKPLMLSHSGLLIIGESLSADTVSEILNICITNKDITGAIKIVATQSAEKLIKIKPKSDIALGYEISNALKQYSAFTGITYKNRFYEVEAKREGATKVYALPYFSAGEENYTIDGLLIYKNDSPVLKVDNNDSAIYSLMSNSYKKGEILFDNSTLKIKLKSVKYDIAYKREKLYINMTMDIDGDDDSIKALSRKINATPIFAEDIYYFADRIYRKKPELWGKIKNDYNNIFKGADLSFEVI